MEIPEDWKTLVHLLYNTQSIIISFSRKLKTLLLLYSPPQVQTMHMYGFLKKMTWLEAQNVSRTNHTDLVSVRNETELRQILSIAPSYDVWIGLYRNRLCSDQSNSTFSNWRPEIQSHIIAEPDNGLYSYGQSGDQHCTAMASNGKWTDENSFPFFCYSGIIFL